jgi:hypothetical protein
LGAAIARFWLGSGGSFLGDLACVPLGQSKDMSEPDGSSRKWAALSRRDLSAIARTLAATS